ncbi:MAG: hypothetical protein LBV21_06160 [Candidatus Adiutrix sp.]|jgi:DNA-binding NtrC family response regulator|nr:hypothetical protein [Candidatus Adiutrix sp.]
MKVIIVGRDAELIDPLADRLTGAGFTVTVAENPNAALAAMKKSNAPFVVADPALLVDQNLGRELLKRDPLVRLVGLAARPTIPGLIEAIDEGLIDYFPRTPDYFDAVVALLENERQRLTRWQRMLLTDSPGE